MAASRVKFTAKTRDNQVSGKSLSRLGPEFYESASGSGEMQFTSLNLPWVYPQGKGSVLDMIDSPVWNSSFLQSARNK